MSSRLEQAAMAAPRPAGELDLLADIVRSSHVGTISARGWYAGGWSLRFEATRDCGFHIVTAGEVSLRLDDGPTVTLRAGDVVLVSTPHVLATDLRRTPVTFSKDTAARMAVEESEAETGLLCGAYLLDDVAQHPVFANLPETIVLRAGARDPSVDAMITVLDGEFRAQAPGGRAVADRLIDAMLVYILRHWVQSDCPRASGWLKALRDPVLGRALALIHGEYAQPWTLERLARASGTSRASLARHFTAEVGTSPMQFLTERRLSVARGLVQSTAMSLDEVATSVGYASGFSLSKAFKRTYGQSPRRLALP
ncbi:MAG: AraC family transcriptional regulator [Myxococcota bacterium]